MPAKAGWIDFRALCKSVDFAKVLDLYHVELKHKGTQAQGFCPLPGHNGQKRSPSFSVNLDKRIWQCFGCSRKGNVIDFVGYMEGLDPLRGKDVRRAAEILQDKLGLSSDPPDSGKRKPKDNQVRPSPPSSSLPVRINTPLDFELKNLNFDHPYLQSRGFSEETTREFGLGYCNRGMFKDRVVIPIHDPVGVLLGYAGRVVDDRVINEENPKYKLPAPRERNGAKHEFHKSQLLYNLHRISKKVSDLIIVEGFPSTWWLWQHGYKNIVALMGSDCSGPQAKLILERVEFDGRVWIFTDGDEAGMRCAEMIFRLCAPYRFVRWARLMDGNQPTDCNAEELQGMLSA